MYMGDRLPKAEMMAVGLPAIPEEDERGPPSGRPISQRPARRVDAQLGCLVIPLHPLPQVLRRPPLRNLSNYRSAGWRKELSHILRGFYLYNYPSRKEEDWDKLKTKFLDYLEQRQEEWKTIKEEEPLQYMPYMECQFQALTSVRLEGLSQFTGWIKPGSYYHGVVARKGQLHLCLHLAGTAPPRGPQIHPSET